MRNFLNINRLLFATGSFALILMVVFWFWWGNTEISINKLKGDEKVLAGEAIKGISGIDCENSKSRPIAIMLPSDPSTRPLSGVGEADMVFEMPVTPSGVTRMMAVYQCEESGEIGSIRSAREDFIPLAAGLNAIYVHWGGERQALDKLNSHVIDNIDAMKYENIYFFRKQGIRPPHNGFTDFDRISRAVDDLQYGKENKFSGYPHAAVKAVSSLANVSEVVEINYPSPFNIQWVYDKEKNTYKRLRDGKAEIDKNSSSQAEASVIIIMETKSEYTSKDYLTVHTTGTGRASVYQNGIEMSARWEKDPSRLDSKLLFLDAESKEIIFVPGKIWVQILVVS